MPQPPARPCRSVLYIPASKARALAKAREVAADAIIFDLEDAVAPDEKAAARDLLWQELAAGGFGNRLLLVRVNGLETPWGADDLASVKPGFCDAVLVPKVNGPADLDSVTARVPGVDLWAMLETAAGMLNAAAIAAHPALRGMVMGTNESGERAGEPPPGRPAAAADGAGPVPAGRPRLWPDHRGRRLQRLPRYRGICSRMCPRPRHGV